MGTDLEQSLEAQHTSTQHISFSSSPRQWLLMQVILEGSSLIYNIWILFTNAVIGVLLMVAAGVSFCGFSLGVYTYKSDKRSNAMTLLMLVSVVIRFIAIGLITVAFHKVVYGSTQCERQLCYVYSNNDCMLDSYSNQKYTSGCRDDYTYLLGAYLNCSAVYCDYLNDACTNSSLATFYGFETEEGCSLYWKVSQGEKYIVILSVVLPLVCSMLISFAMKDNHALSLRPQEDQRRHSEENLATIAQSAVEERQGANPGEYKPKAVTSEGDSERPVSPKHSGSERDTDRPHLSKRSGGKDAPRPRHSARKRHSDRSNGSSSTKSDRPNRAKHSGNDEKAKHRPHRSKHSQSKGGEPRRHRKHKKDLQNINGIPDEALEEKGNEMLERDSERPKTSTMQHYDEVAENHIIEEQVTLATVPKRADSDVQAVVFLDSEEYNEQEHSDKP